MKVMRLTSGRITSPPGPRNRSRDEILSGRCQRTGVPVKDSFFFLGLARPVSIEVILTSRATTISVRSARMVFIAFSAATKFSKGANRGSNKGTGLQDEQDLQDSSCESCKSCNHVLINTGAIHKILLTVAGVRASLYGRVSAVGL